MVNKVNVIGTAKRKRLMLLGGIRYLKPVIDAAHALGAHVITADYLPDNIAHKYSDEYVNVSIIDRDAVLKAAQEREIDGIMSFACDPGVATAAYVAERMGLPFQCSYESARILQDKGLFRDFLSRHGFDCPRARRYTDADAALADAGSFTWPVIVKPVDSAGSKGVTKVEAPEGLRAAAEVARAGSHSGAFVVEEFIVFEGHHSSTDPFTVDGRLTAVSYSDQLFDREAANPYTPAFIIWPTTMAQAHQDRLTGEVQRLMGLLGCRTGIYNVETCVGAGGVPYIMEVSPRGGGCKIAEIQEMAFGANLIENEVRKALGLPLTEIRTRPVDGHWCEMVIHARPGQQGVFRRLEIREDVRRRNVRAVDLSVREGDEVLPFTGANRTLGDMFLRFDSREELDACIADTGKWLDVVVDGGGRGA